MVPAAGATAPRAPTIAAPAACPAAAVRATTPPSTCVGLLHLPSSRGRRQRRRLLRAVRELRAALQLAGLLARQLRARARWRQLHLVPPPLAAAAAAAAAAARPTVATGRAIASQQLYE